MSKVLVSASTTGAAGAMAPALPAPPANGERNYVTGFSVDGLGATAGSVIEVSLVHSGGTYRRKLTIPAGVTAALASPLEVSFGDDALAIDPGAAATLNVPSFGAGNTSATSTIRGYRA